MERIAENAIEKFAIDLLERQGYQYIYAPSIAPNSKTPQRQSFEVVLLMERLQTAVGRINPSISKMSENSKQIKTLEKLRDTLLPKLMSGEVRVN